MLTSNKSPAMLSFIVRECFPGIIKSSFWTHDSSGLACPCRPELSTSPVVMVLTIPAFKSGKDFAAFSLIAQKCCEMLGDKTECLDVLLQLPAPQVWGWSCDDVGFLPDAVCVCLQLQMLLQNRPDMRPPLLTHAQRHSGARSLSLEIRNVLGLE